MSLMYWERAENRVQSNVPIETREYIAEEYPGESVAWVLRESSRPERARRRTALRTILARVGFMSARPDPVSNDDCRA